MGLVLLYIVLTCCMHVTIQKSDNTTPTTLKVRMTPSTYRRLEDNGMEENDYDDDNTYDVLKYYQNNTYSFTDYSLKFATCQKVQRFSKQAVQKGEYSAMITDDIVVLRLCPRRRCSSSTQYGCSAGYGEYAMELVDYLKLTMRYQYDRLTHLCNFCEKCSGYNRRLEDYYEGADDEDNQVDDFYSYTEDDNSSNNTYYYYEFKSFNVSKNMCYAYSSTCSYHVDTCSSSYYDDDNNKYAAANKYLDYTNYMGCKKVEGQNANDYYFWVNPYCDPYSNSIKMGIFYDPYCSQYAGDDLDVSEYTGIDFDNTMFSHANSDACIDCSQSNDPPYFSANNNFCNNVYKKSGKCNTYLAYDVDADDDAVDSKQNSEVNCAYIESIRYGTYDNLGQIYVSNSQSNSSQSAVVTKGQGTTLTLLSILCGGLAIYSCFLHHEITNLLLKSLSVGLVEEKKRRSRSRSRRSRSKSTTKRGNRNQDYESDWD